MTAYLAAHPYASAIELAEVRAAERGQDPHQVPYFDLTVSAVKSVSVLHASYRVCARQARDRGEDDRAAAFDARADELEDALLDSARETVSWLDRHAAYTRTGHHSARTGEWRDGGGLVASLFLAPPVPRRGPAAARARRDLEPDPARRRRRRHVADPGLPVPARPAARRRPGRGPDPGDQAVCPRVRHGGPGRRQRRRDRRGPPGRDGPVQLPRRRRHRRNRTPRPRLPGRARQTPEQAHAVAAAPAGPGRTPRMPPRSCGKTTRGGRARPRRTEKPAGSPIRSRR